MINNCSKSCSSIVCHFESLDWRLPKMQIDASHIDFFVTEFHISRSQMFPIGSHSFWSICVIFHLCFYVYIISSRIRELRFFQSASFFIIPAWLFLDGIGLHIWEDAHTHTSGSRFARRVCKKNRPKRSPSHLHMHNVYREKSSPSIRVSSVIFMTNSPKVAKYVEWRKLAESGHPGPKALCMNDRNDCGPRLRGLFSAVGSLFLQASVIQFPIGFCYRQVVILLWLLGIAIIISKWKA
jgi:hypothetical protein